MFLFLMILDPHTKRAVAGNVSKKRECETHQEKIAKGSETLISEFLEVERSKTGTILTQ